MPIIHWTANEVMIILIQMIKPISIGFLALVISDFGLVFKPIAPIAMTIRNDDDSLIAPSVAGLKVK